MQTKTLQIHQTSIQLHFPDTTNQLITQQMEFSTAATTRIT
jgi:hypothetical protein